MKFDSVSCISSTRHDVSDDKLVRCNVISPADPGRMIFIISPFFSSVSSSTSVCTRTRRYYVDALDQTFRNK